MLGLDLGLGLGLGVVALALALGVVVLLTSLDDLVVAMETALDRIKFFKHNQSTIK